MKAILFLAPLLLLGACSTTGVENFDKVVTTLHDNGCHASVNMTVQVGAINPTSGFVVTSLVDCAAATSPTPTGLAAKVGATTAEHSAPGAYLPQ